MRDPDPDQVRPAIEEPPAGDPPTGPQPTTGSNRIEQRFANRPPGYPNALVWLRAGIMRDWRGVLGAFVATWFYVPVALLAAVYGAFSLAVIGLIGGTQVAESVPQELRDAPLIGGLIDAFLTRSGGVLGGFIGFGVGFLVGFLVLLVLPWRTVVDEPATLFTGLAGMVAAAALVGLLYTLYRVLLEPWLLSVSGARRLSRRETERLRPILYDCAQRLGLPSVPRLLIEDNTVLTNARAYSRHVVVTTSLLTESDEDIAALLSHELVHWRTGDEVTSAFVRGVALPLVLIHAVPTWLMRTFPHPVTDFLLFVFFWPVLLTMKYVVLPLHSRDVRAAEYRADAGAVLAGHAQGMRDMLEQRKSFESGRSGWDEAVCATHPASELRLDRLERLSPVAEAGGVRADDDAILVSSADLFPGPGSVANRQTLVVAGALALVCCLGGTLLTVTQWALFRPQVVVGDYFSALDDHDGREALSLLDPDVRAGLDGDQLAAMVGAKGYQPPTDVKVTSMKRDGDEAVATVAFTLAGQQVTSELPLRREESATLGLFHGWRITAGLTALSLPGVPGLTVNGVPVPVAEEGTVVALLPGAYTLGGASNALSETPSQTVAVRPGQDSVSNVRLTPTLTATGQEAAEQSVRQYLDACAATTVAAPENCPFRFYNGATVQKIAWKIIEYPKIQMELTGPTTARVSTPYETQGSARATGSTAGFYGTTPFTEDETFGVSGVLSLVDGKLTFRAGDE
ncbi:M48 family metalloprotease [Micromonospora rubida]